MANKTLREQVAWLINTSVDDMKCSLSFHGVEDLAMLRAAYKTVMRRGEKTKAKLLIAKIRKLEKLALSLPAFRETPMDGAR